MTNVTNTSYALLCFLQIRVHDIRAKTSACTILPMEVSDATVRSYY